MSTKALAVPQDIDVTGSALEPYGNRELVRELVDRLMTFHPASKEVGREGMFQAAQLALLMGASPLPGVNEIHIWKDKEKIKVEPGINYWRRRAEQKGGVRWIEQPRPMSEYEREVYGIREQDLGAICRGMRTTEYLECRAEGMSYAEAVAACAVTGIGVVAKTDYPKAGRPLVWTAIKRCETDFHKRAFPYIPGEGMPGAGLRQGEHGFEPDFEHRSWVIEEQREKRELPAGASIDWLRDGTHIRADAGESPDWSPDWAWDSSEEPDAGELQTVDGELMELVPDYRQAALQAQTLDAFADAAYHLPGSRVAFESPARLAAWVSYVGNGSGYNPGRNAALLDALDSYCRQIADGVKASVAAPAARERLEQGGDSQPVEPEAHEEPLF